ncbi:MAG: Lrp/AsnC family transcriptional regulator [Pseudomonadota bacterium]
MNKIMKSNKPLNGVLSPDNDLNQKIIRLLQHDGRMPYNEIAKQLDVSEGTVRNRVNGLRDNNQLRIAAMVDPVADEYKTTAMIGLKAASGFTPGQIGARLAENEMVVFILWVSGRYDLLIEVVTDERDEFHSFLEREIHGCDDISSSDLMLGLKNIKNQYLLKSHWGQASVAKPPKPF